MVAPFLFKTTIVILLCFHFLTEAAITFDNDGNGYVLFIF